MAVFTKNSRKHIFIHPGDQHKTDSAIRTVLMRDRRKYSDRLGGALLDVNNIKVIGDRHLVVNGYLSLEVVADFKIFAPTIGMSLTGRINKVHKNYCGCVAMDFFNATLSYPFNMGDIPKEGDICSFVVRSLTVNGDMLHMRGQLQSFEESQTVEEDTSNIDSLKDLKREQKKSSKEEDSDKVLEPNTNGSERTGTMESDEGLLSDSLEKGRTTSPRKKDKKKKRKREKTESSDECITEIKAEVGISGDYFMRNDNNNGASKEDRDVSGSASSPKKGKQTVKPLSENDSTSPEKKHKKKKKKIKEERIESSMDECDATIKEEIGISGDSYLEEDLNSSRKKHKKKLKEKNSLDLSMDTAGDDTIVKSELEFEGESVTESNRSAKKKHKKSKDKDSDLNHSLINGDSSSIKIESEPGYELASEHDKSSKNKHKRKSKEEITGLNASNMDTAEEISESNETVLSQTPKDKSKKKKHKKRRRSESEDEIDPQPETKSTSPIQKAKKMKKR